MTEFGCKTTHIHVIGFLERHVEVVLTGKHVRVAGGERFRVFRIDHWLAVSGKDGLGLKKNLFV